MPKLVDVENIGLIEVPDDMGENELLEFVGTLDQGALPAAGNALMREGGRMTGGAMMGLTRVGLEEPAPLISAAQAESPAAMAAYERRQAAWEKRVKEVSPEETMARAAMLEASPTFQMGKALQEGAKEAFPVNPLREEDFLTQVASGLGSLPVSMVPGVGQAAYAFRTGEDAAQRAGQFYDVKIAQALAEGNIAEVNRLQAEKPTKQYQAAFYTAPIGGLTERVVGAVPAINQALAGKVGKNLLDDIFKPLLGEAGQEGLEQGLGNAVAQKTYNPDQKLSEGVYDSTSIGGTVGGLVGLVTGGAGRYGRVRRMSQIQEQRLVEGPTPGGQRLQEIIDRQAAGVAAIGGDPNLPLPNATATLAGINSGGAPSGPFRVTPPVTGGAPDDEAKIPDIALETDVTDEEIATAVAPETPAAAETPADPEEVQPLTIEETNEYNTIIDFLDGRSAFDTLEDDQWDRFNDLSFRVRELEDAGFEFDEATGWTKPGVVTQEAVPVSKEPALNPEEYSDYVNLLRREAEAEGGDNSAEFGFGEKQALTLYRTKIATGVAPTAPAEVPVTPSETPTVPAAVTPAPGVAATAQNQPLTIEETQEFNGINSAIGNKGIYSALNEEEQARYNYLNHRRLGLFRVITPKEVAAAPVNPEKIRARMQQRPARPTPAPATPTTSRTFPFQNRTVDGMIDRDTGDIVTFAKSIAGTPVERGSQPKYTVKIDQDVSIDAQSEVALDKALQRISPGAPVRVFRNAGKGVTLDFNKPGPVTPTPTPPTRTVVLTPGAVTVTQTPAAAPAPTPTPAPSTISDENQTLLKNIGITAKANADGTISLIGRTFDWRNDIKEFGGRFADKSWRISADGFGKFIERARPSAATAVGQPGGRPAYVADSGLRKLRADADNRPDRSGLDGGVGNYVGEDTQQLIRQGEAFGIPSVVIDEQIEDVALMAQAFRQKRPLFMLSSAPGTGKTFVLGAAIRELRRSGANKIVYVTLRKELITQIKQDLKDYGIGDVEFITYAEMKDRPAKASDVLIFDEAHAIKNLSGDGSEQAKKAQEWMSQTKFPVLSTATPFENPVQAAYLASTGIFEPFGGFKNFALAYGATSVNIGNDTILVWRRTNTSNADQVAARNFFKKEGIFTARKTRLPKDQVDSRLVKVTADSQYTKMYRAFEKAVEENKGSLAGFSKAWIKNFQKRILEASKIAIAINEASNALKAGRWPIVFVETKAERKIDIPRLLDLEDQWRREADLARRMGEKIPSRSIFGLPPMGITDVLASFMEETGISVIEIPSAEDTIKAKFGEDNVAIFTGSVTPAKAQKNLDKWRGNKPMVLVATMAKGGTGLSLHDKTGNHQTTQINVNLPWTATQVEQVSLRSARYGLKGIAQMQWLFADNIPFDRELAQRVGSRMADMGALVHGELPTTAASIQNWNFEDDSFSEANADQADKNDLIKQETAVTPPAAPTPPVAPTPAAPTATAPKKRYKAREWAFKGDILDDIIDSGGVMSKSQANKEGRLERIKDLYDDAPRLDAYFNKIFAGRSRGTTSGNLPDQLLAELAYENPGKYGDMSVSEFWAEVDKAARGRKGDVAAAKQEAKAAAAGAEEAMGLDAFLQAQDDAFVDAQTEGMQSAGEPDGPIQISVGSLALGDKFSVQGEQFEVTVVTPDGGYTIRDGEKFGVQLLTEYDTLFVDEPPDSGGGDVFEFPTEGPAPTERKPRLAAGQNQGDLISSTQVEDFALVGEKGVDLEARKQKAQAAARAAAEAKAAQEKAQNQMDFGQSALDAIDQITRNIDENQYSDPLLLTPLAKLALQIAKGLIRAGMAIDRAIRQAVAQARESYPNDPVNDTQLSNQLIGLMPDQPSQDVSSADTSLAQIPAVFKSKIFVPRGKNLDIGAGKFDLGKEYLESERGVEESVPFDPFNRSVESNRAAVDRLQSGEQFGTTTVPNVLNVIAEAPARDNVILQAAQALEPNGVAYFQIYEGDRSGNGRRTSRGFQNNKKTSDYVAEVRKHFRDVRTSGNIIVASNPKASGRVSFWQLSSDLSGPTVRLTPSLDGLSDAVAEVSDAIAQFVESITPKAGITEGPTPEESARRVLETLTNLASVAIRAGIQSASRWATGLQMKLSPALQYAWDRAQGSTAEPTPEVIADVATLPERATSSDFGMIYSTPGKPVTTKRGAYEDTVAGRRSRTPEVQSAGIQLAVDTFNEAGVKFRQVGDALFAPVDGVEQEAAGRKLIEVAKAKIAEAKKQGRSDTIAELIQSLRNHFGVSEAFSPDTRDELYLIGQSEASQFGINLASLRASVKDFVAMARNVRGFLTSAIYDNFNGESVKGVMDKIMTEFRGQFTEAEIQKIVGEKPELQQMLNRFGVLALADTGGRVYRTVQARLTTKKPTTQKAKEQREIENEAIEQIIRNALALGVTEPAQPANRKLTADERLALMTRPGTQAKVQKATEDAVKEAEFNAGWNVMMASAAGDEELLGQYRDAMAAEEDPDPEAIEEGLDLPKYAHWRTIRDGFLNYSPTTLKLAQDVIRGRFKGTQFGPKKVAPPAPAKIDLARLVQSPNAEMSRVIGEQLAAIEGVMDLAGASPEAKARVMQMITANVGSQVQLARQRVLNNFLEVKAKVGPTTASARLQRLINAGITEDKRYQSEPTRKLLKRVAKTYLKADELSGMATRPRAEKLAFLTGKLNQITAAEKLTDEWMQGAVWTYLTERMMEAENAVVSQIVGAKDVSFDPALPKTDAQLAADRAKAVERLAGGIRAGLLDQRIAESVAKNPALQRLVPKMSDLVKRALNTPQAGQAKLAQTFSEALLAELAIDQALADKTGIALAKAFEVKFERARIQALDKAVKNLTPKQREEVGPGTPLWQKIEQFVNAGGMNSATLLQSIAKKSGWKIPTDEEVSRFRDLARLEQELSTATEKEINAGITDDIKAAMNEAKRLDIMRELQMRWARMTMPIRGNKQNLARAAKEYGSANTLLKFGFITKQLIDVATQMFIYTPSRATATAIQRFTTSRDPSRTLRLWKDVSNTLEDAYKARFDALDMAYKSAIQAAKGRAEKDTIMGLQTGMRALDRLKAQADEYAKKGNYAQATVLRIIGIAQLSYRFASSLDAFQGVLAEQQEIGAWTESQLRLQGMAPAEARKAAKIIMGDALAEYALAQALIGDDPNIAPKDRSAAAWNVVRARQYQRIATAGLDAGDIKGITQNLRSTIGWNVEEEGGPGGVIGQAMKSTGKILSRIGIPDLLGMFSNAVAIGVNRGFTFAGGGFVPGVFEGSAWYKTETDKVQRKIEAATGLGLSGLFVGLVLSGALRVFTHWPDDKEEADLWEREGHKPNTMELDLPGGKILRVSLSTGPFQFVRPALAAVGELQYQQARRDRLNQKAGAAAKKKGLKFEPRELTAMDIVSALGYGAWSAIAQGRTTSGLIGAGTYRGTADVGKIAAATVSPLIPFGPLMREATAMSGAQFNPKDQTFINLLAPTPWSGKVDRNFLGDPVGTPRATERIMSILTGGTAIVGGEDPDRAYQVLAKTGWTPATPQSNKFFQFGRVQRQATPEELTRMQEVRAVELKTRISQLDPATATKRQLDRIEDIANAKSKKAVGIR